MWTGRQTVTAVATFVALVLLFNGYEQTLGRLTDFEPIDPALLKPMDDTDTEQSPTGKANYELAAERAFEDKSIVAELSEQPMKFDNPQLIDGVPVGRGIGVYMFAHEYQMQKNGNPRLVEFRPFTMVQITGDPKAAPDRDDVTSVRADTAVVEFDRDVDISKLSSGRPKPVAGWLEGRVRLCNNQRIADHSNDLTFLTERLDYQEVRNMVWTSLPIRLLGPDHLDVTGLGMEMDLQEKGPDGKPKHKNKAEARRVRLLETVRFHMMVEEGGHILGGAQPETKAPPAEKSKAPLIVTSKGPFDFDMETHQANFRKTVVVSRPNPPSAPPGEDRVLCDHLLLQFVERADEQPAPVKGKKAKKAVPSSQERLTLQTATATGDPVVLFSQAQKLSATGDFLFHDASKARTVLSAKQEMVATQDNVNIHGRSLVISQSEAPEPPGAKRTDRRRMLVEGPNGYLEVVDKTMPRGAPGSKELTTKFQKSLRVEPEAGGATRLVTIIGAVEMELPRQSLVLTGREVQIRLEELDAAPIGRANAPKSDVGKANGEKKLEPTWLLAIDNAAADSPEFSVNAHRKLTMHIAHRPAAPAPAVAPAPTPAMVATAKSGSKGLPHIAVGKSGSRHVAQPVVAEPPPEAEQRGDPLEVRAEEVEVYVVKVGGHTEPVRAYAEGEVFVRRAGPKVAEDDAIEIKGVKLYFERQQGGDRLKVWGSERRLADFSNRQFRLKGNELIDIDEVRNKMHVAGPGTLVLANSSRLTSSPEKAETSRPLTIEWMKQMDFDGQNARFEKEVIAHQEDQQVRCRIMVVWFLNRLVFRSTHQKDGTKERQKMEVGTVDCDGDVVVDEQEFIDGDPKRFARYSILQAPIASFDNRVGIAKASGPNGQVVYLERIEPVPGENGAPVEPEFKYNRTEVLFKGRMDYRKQERTVDFFENVKVLRSPVAAVDEKPNSERLRPEAVKLDSEHAQVHERFEANGEKIRDFFAEDNVKLHTKNWDGIGDECTYDQRKDLATLRGNPANLFRQDQPGANRDTTTAKEILYYVKANRTSAHGVDRIDRLDIGADAAPPAGPRKAPVNNVNGRQPR